MDRIRDLVAAGNVSVVLAQDRDRFSREPAYAYLLRREFEEHGCRIRALNDRGDDSPEGQLTDVILNQLAKYERAKMAERTRRGKLQKAREGRVMASTPNYGFRFNAAKDGLVVCESEMAVVEKIFRMAAEGLGLRAMQTRLRAEGISSPKGGQTWALRVLRRLLESDVYLPRTYQEISELASPETLTRIDPARQYGVQWYKAAEGAHRDRLGAGRRGRAALQEAQDVRLEAKRGMGGGTGAGFLGQGPGRACARHGRCQPGL
jgi:site-specific DNA recombinase